MKQHLWLPLLAIALVVGLPAAWAVPVQAAQEMKPLVVVSLSGYDELMGDVAYVGKLADNPDLAKGLEAILKLFTRSQGLAGVDKARPWGAVLQTDGRELAGVAFVPVTDLKKLLGVVEMFGNEVSKTDDGVYRIKNKRDVKSVFVEQKGGWAFVTDKPANLKQAPADPRALLGQLPKQYDLAVAVHAANVPAEHREKLLAEMKRASDRDAQRRSGESEQQHAIRKKIADEMLRSVVTLVNDADQLVLGWTLDHRAEKTFLEFSITARPGTETARQAAELRETKTSFGGFRLPEAALTGNWVGKLPESKVALLTTVVEGIRMEAMKGIEKQPRSAEEIKLAKELVGDVLEVIQQTVRSAKIDGGMAVRLQSDAVTVLAGGHLSDATRLNKVAKTLAELAAKENPAVAGWVKLDAAEFQGVRFHTVSIPVPPDAKDRQKVVGLIGETLEVVIGTGKESLYVAAGRDALKSLKQAIERSAAEAYKSVPPLEFSLDLRPVANFLAAVGEEKDRPRIQWIAAELAKTPKTDHIHLVAQPIPNGVKYRLEVEQGVLQLLGRIGTLATGLGGK